MCDSYHETKQNVLLDEAYFLLDMQGSLDSTSRNHELKVWSAKKCSLNNEAHLSAHDALESKVSLNSFTPDAVKPSTNAYTRKINVQYFSKPSLHYWGAFMSI